MQKKKLFLLDAMALIYRAYFAFSKNHRVNSKGLNTSAIFGFTNTLTEILKKENPTHIAVVFDTQTPTVRHIEFEAYKANREEMPEDLSLAIPYIVRLIEAFNIPCVSVEGYEADDVIGTLAKMAEKLDFETYMMTPDKDYGQLVSPTTFIYKPARLGNGSEVLGVADILKKWDIQRIDQLIDILGLMGDAVDNIPGIPGVGEKTAIQLIKDFDTIENLLENTDKLKGKLKEKVELNKAMAIQSKRLATIICDVPLTVTPDDLLARPMNKQALSELFGELEFRRLSETILGEPVATAQHSVDFGLFASEGTSGTSGVGSGAGVASGSGAGSRPGAGSRSGAVDGFGVKDTDLEDGNVFAPERPIYRTIADVPHEYKLVDTPELMDQLANDLAAQKQVSWDTETTGTDVHTAELVGISFSYQPHVAFYVPIAADQQQARAQVARFKPFFEKEGVLKIGQNLKFDLAIIRRYGIELAGPLFDTMLAHFLIQPEMRHGMNVLSETYLGYSPVPIEQLIGEKGKNQGTMRDVAIDQITAYAAEDADITLQLKEQFEPKLAETNTLGLFTDVEVPLLRVLEAMEAEGITLDKSVLKTSSDLLTTDIQQAEREIQEMAGGPFNIASPKQVGEVLFERLKIVDKAKKTKTGQYATGEDVLSKLAGKHPIVDKILEYRELVKLKNTYVDALPLLVNPVTGRLHTSYNQVVAVTGRLSSDNPNLQNIPIRTQRGREIRKAFVPRSGEFTLLAADYSQIELRIMAHLSADPAMVEAFVKGLDIHTATAARVYGVELDAVTTDMRRNAKMVNFGIIYGISAFGLSERLNIARKEAADIIQNYFEQYPGVKSFMDLSIEKAREKGYVETLMGRRRYLRDINSSNATVRGFAERNAINAPIQGTAADMIKVAMIRIDERMRKEGLKSKMLLQVHDELVFDAHLQELELVKVLVEECMRNALPLSVPIEVSLGHGENWLVAH